MKMLVLLFPGFPFFTSGQITHAVSTVKYLYAGQLSAASADIFNCAYNPAMLPAIKEMSIGLTTEQLFLIKDWKAASMVFAAPVQHAGYGFTIDYSGNHSYTQTTAAASYGRTLGRRISMGMQFHYSREVFRNYGNESGVGAECAAVLHLTDQLDMGFQCTDAGSAANGHFFYRLPLTWQTELSYEVSDKCAMNLGISKTIALPPEIIVSIYYSYYKTAFFQAAIATRSSQSFFSTGITFNATRVATSFAFHPRLGITPGLLVSLRLKEVKNVDEK
jgi:hypothetical protein